MFGTHHVYRSLLAESNTYADWYLPLLYPKRSMSSYQSLPFDNASVEPRSDIFNIASDYLVTGMRCQLFFETTDRAALAEGA